MQEKYNVTGMTCAACQARVQKKRIQPDRRARVQCQSVKKQYGGDLRRQKCKQWADHRRCRKGGLWRIPTAGQRKISCTGGLPGGHGEKGI